MTIGNHMTIGDHMTTSNALGGLGKILAKDCYKNTYIQCNNKTLLGLRDYVGKTD